jgi:hypothetical protein
MGSGRIDGYSRFRIAPEITLTSTLPLERLCRNPKSTVIPAQAGIQNVVKNESSYHFSPLKSIADRVKPSRKSPQPPFAKGGRGDFWKVFSRGKWPFSKRYIVTKNHVCLREGR